ncbi:MAG: diguanylate cyclase [Thermodesulfobacteriota bacterium]
MSFDPNAVSLRVKILASLFVALGLSMAASLYGIWSFERGKLIEISRNQAVQAGLTIRSALRHAMLQHNTEAITSSIEEIARGTLLSHICVLDANGRIVFSSEPQLRGQVLDLAKEPECLACHTDGERHVSQRTALLNVHDRPTLRNILPIANEPACHGCHAPDRRTLGVFMFDSSLAPFDAVLRQTASRLLLTGLLTLAGIFVLISTIVTRFITRPVRGLLDGFERLGNGQFGHWLELGGSREFADISTAFNVMSRAVGRYLGEVRAKAKEIATLYTIVQRMSRSIEWKQVKEVVVSLLTEILDADSVVLVIPIEKRPNHFAVYWREEGQRLFRRDYSPDAPHAPHPALSRQEFRRWLDERFTSPVFLAGHTRVLIPLLFKDTQFGLIAVAKKPGQEFVAAEMKLVAAVTQHVSIAFTNARLYDMAITDSLTSLYTKRYLMTKLHDLVHRFQRLPEDGFCLLMLDLDHFKEVNDTFGHQVGDQLLVQMARLIQSNVRHEDIPCRYGGEEFVILIPGKGLEESLGVAERLRSQVEGYTFAGPDLTCIQRTVSIGVACCPGHGTTADALIAAADAALYTAKRDGRNLVRVPSEAPQAG